MQHSEKMVIRDNKYLRVNIDDTIECEESTTQSSNTSEQKSIFKDTAKESINEDVLKGNKVMKYKRISGNVKSLKIIKKKGVEIRVCDDKGNDEKILLLTTKKTMIPDVGCNIITYVKIDGVLSPDVVLKENGCGSLWSVCLDAPQMPASLERECRASTLKQGYGKPYPCFRPGSDGEAGASPSPTTLSFNDISTCENMSIYLPKEITLMMILMREIMKSESDLLMMRIINIFKSDIWIILLIIYIKIKRNEKIDILEINAELNKMKYENDNMMETDDDDEDDIEEKGLTLRESVIQTWNTFLTEMEINYMKKLSEIFVNYMKKRYGLENETEINTFMKRESELNIFINSLGININENMKQKIEDIKNDILEEIFEKDDNILQLVEILHTTNTKKMAIKMGMSEKIINKIDVYGEFIQYANNWGHSCVKRNTLEMLCKKVTYNQKIVDELTNEDKILVKYNACSKESKKEEMWYYDKNNYEAEVGISKFLRNKLQQESNLGITTKDMREDDKLNKLQKEAINMIFNKKLSILTGYPGTGKTHVISEMLKILKENNRNIKVGVYAPTGKAVTKLKETIGKYMIMEVMTLHSQLYKMKLNKDIIIIDEISMVSNDVFYRFIKKLKRNCHVVLVGDPNQLASVEKGYILDQLIKIKEIPNIHLTELMRSDINSINLNTSLNEVLEGKIPSKKNGKGFTWYKDVENVDDILYALTNKYEDINKIMYLTPFNNEVTKYQKMLKDIYNPIKNKYKREHNYDVGDIVIQNKNMKYDELHNLIIYNGTLGIITDASKNIVTVNFTLDEYHSVELTYGMNSHYDIKNISHRYILTIHKQQGSEAPIVVIYIPPNYNSFILTRNLLYTGISRAKQKCILIADELTVKNCVKRKCFRHSNIMNMFYNI